MCAMEKPPDTQRLTVKNGEAVHNLRDKDFSKKIQESKEYMQVLKNHELACKLLMDKLKKSL